MTRRDILSPCPSPKYNETIPTVAQQYGTKYFHSLEGKSFLSIHDSFVYIHYLLASTLGGQWDYSVATLTSDGSSFRSSMVFVSMKSAQAK